MSVSLRLKIGHSWESLVVGIKVSAECSRFGVLHVPRADLGALHHPARPSVQVQLSAPLRPGTPVTAPKMEAALEGFAEASVGGGCFDPLPIARARYAPCMWCVTTG